MSFKDIRGHDTAIGFLKNSMAGGKVSQAYMFVGPSGVGKKTAAINFAKALNCLDPKDGNSCDVCIQCRKIDAANHPDVRIFAPAKEEGSFGIDIIRAVIGDINLKPYEARRKVYILDRAEAMRHEAQNALLKTLEEPASDSVLVLIVENADALVSTIRSRAKRVTFSALAPEEAERILIEKHKIEPDNARILSRISSGELGRALKYSKEGFFEKRGRMIDALKEGSFPDSEFEKISKTELRLVLDIILSWYRDLLIAKSSAEGSAGFINSDKAVLIREASKRISFDSLNNIVKRIILTCSFLEQNINPKLAMAALEGSLNLCTKSSR
ncbi:MAG: DNA polymerase III subunit delta' C-terminal domain-containing protein [Candidatus Omnitrophica bacterium]|nr:DNA polymerase III subunit delta' C-terminal domain-containing protein [Candidatus Omnitrophota bacterium]